MKIVLLFLFFSLESASLAEPWLATRYAQNCAGCHAPGRKNLPVADRRCTLACQGCHVSPNGGGLRSFYGKWNENKWLRSIAPRSIGADKAVAPIKLQKYGRKKYAYKKGKKTPKGGFPLVELKKFVPDSKEAIYDRRDGLEKKMASRKEFEYQVPRTDPYRDMDLYSVDAGGDFRYQMRSHSITVTAQDADDNPVGDPTEVEAYGHWPMTFDASVSVRPFHRKLRFVYETRALAGPPGGGKASTNPDVAAAGIKRRSLYAMVDDLPYNLYVMGGYYRPLFGYYTPDHTFLPQAIQNNALGSTYNQEFLAYSVGGSPNVPYANLHYIVRQTNGGQNINQNVSGFAANLGARWVTMGISANMSYWSTTDTTNEDDPSQVNMFSLFGSINISRITLSLDLQSVEKTNVVGDEDENGQKFLEDRIGGVYSADAFIQLYRAIYANVQYAYSNSATDLTVGSASQIRLGLRSFLMQGTDISFHYQIEDQTKVAKNKTSVLTELKGYMVQIHLYM